MSMALSGRAHRADECPHVRFERNNGHDADVTRCLPIADIRGTWVGRWASCPASMLGKREGPLRAQLPISASVVGRYDVVVGSDAGIDRLVTDLEDAPDAAADGHSPAIIVISLPIRAP